MTVCDGRETSQNREHEEPRDYRPLIIRTKSLLALMILTCSLIILLEVLRQILPTRPRTQFTSTLFLQYPWAVTTAPAIFFASIWTAMDLNVMRMEPIYQIAESEGDQTGLNDSLFFSYTTCSAFTVPLHALKRKHWAVLYSSLANLIASIALPAVVVEMVDLDFASTQYGTPNSRARLRPAFLWVTSGLLVVLLFLTAALIRTLWGRRSGVKADPSSIVGLAITFADANVMAHLRLLEPDSPCESARLTWLYRRHKKQNPGTVVRNHDIELVAEQPLLTSQTEQKSHFSEPVFEQVFETAELSDRIRTTSKYPILGVLLTSLLLIIGITAISFILATTNIQEGPGEWLYDHTNIARPVSIVIATIIKSIWTTLERDAQISEPYVQLSKHESGSKKAILASVYGSPFESFFVALRNGYIYPLTIAFTTILSEVLTIFLPGLFHSTGYAVALPIAIPVFMLVVWSVAFWRTKKRGLPRSPETIAGALSYLCESRLPGDLRHMRMLNDEERRKAIEAMNNDYVLVLTPGMNGGGLRWTIDSTV